MPTIAMLSSERYRRQKPVDGKCQICHQPTNKKPYCIDHIENIPYVKDLMSKINDKDSELALVKKRGMEVIQEGSIIVEEIADLLFQEKKPLAKIAQEISIKEAIARIYLTYMEKHQLVKIVATTGGGVYTALDT